MNKVYVKFIATLCILLAFSTFAQRINFNTQRNWSLNKKELKEPTKGKIIGRKEFQKLQMDMMQQEMPGMMQMRRGNN